MVEPSRRTEYSVLLERVYAMPSSAARKGKSMTVLTTRTPLTVVSAVRFLAISVREYREHNMTNMTGTIKRLVSDKGFGFVAASDGNEYFFHQSSVTDAQFDQLREGQAVTFNTGQGPKGPRAENVRLA